MPEPAGPDTSVDPTTSPLFDADAGETPAAFAGALAMPVEPGHFDEMHGVLTPAMAGPAQPPAGYPPFAPLWPFTQTAGQSQSSSSSASPRSETPPPPLAPEWEQFFNHLGTDGFSDLNRRTAALQRQ
ncbi:MAG: A circularly permuted ATPgrasp family protein, partial [Burkholderiaceae bacterium]|nr:A circularly permuted ATPgrasp family protein [Burkholderiaceae bacterium]